MEKLFQNKGMRLSLTLIQNNESEPSAFFDSKEGADGFFGFDSIFPGLAITDCFRLPFP